MADQGNVRAEPSAASMKKAHEIAIGHAKFPDGRIVYGPMHYTSLKEAIAHAVEAAREDGRREIFDHAADQGVFTIKDDAKGWKFSTFAGACLTDDGVVRKVLGTLPVTADEVVCGIGAIVYTEGGAEWQACVHNDAHEPSQCEGGDPSTPLHQCYSTREAAEAARTNQRISRP